MLVRPRIALVAAALAAGAAGGCSADPPPPSAAAAPSPRPVAVAADEPDAATLPVRQQGAVDAGDGVAAIDGGVDAGGPESTVCPEDMVSIDGEYCPRLVQTCLKRRKPWQCAEFKRPSVCEGATVRKRYCIDRYEHGNHAGSLPTVMSSWNHAKATCASLGKRLCTEAEWTLACEGPERLPFPYGYARDPLACPIDKPSPRVDERRLFAPSTQAAELARLDQREPSGSRPRCVSAYGVFDMTGNVAERGVNETRVPYKSALKGGSWGEYRNACRPSTRGHDEGFFYYQMGFRCCRDAPAP